MAFVKTFCFYFSCRLGSIVIGVFNLIQITIWLSLCIHCINNKENVSERIEDMLEDEDFDWLNAKDILQKFKTDPSYYFGLILVFFIFFGLSCVAMMYGAYKIEIKLVYPFILFDFVYITILLITHVMAMLIMKKNEYGLGDLILYSVLGEFVFLYLYYTWICVVAYCQIVFELKKKVDKIKLLGQNTENKSMYTKQY